AVRDQPAVISDHLWRTAFDASRNIIGRQIVVGRKPYAIVGVMPPGFRSPSVAIQTVIHLSPDDSVWVPLLAGPSQIGNRGNRGLRILARGNPSPRIEGVQHPLAGAAARLAAAYPDSNRNIRVQVLPLAESVS